MSSSDVVAEIQGQEVPTCCQPNTPRMCRQNCCSHAKDKKKSGGGGRWARFACCSRAVEPDINEMELETMSSEPVKDVILEDMVSLPELDDKDSSRIINYNDNEGAFDMMQDLRFLDNKSSLDSFYFLDNKSSLDRDSGFGADSAFGLSINSFADMKDDATLDSRPDHITLVNLHEDRSDHAPRIERLRDLLKRTHIEDA